MLQLYGRFNLLMMPVTARHDEILREQVEAAGGRITKHTGDGITAVFDGGEPVACALQSQMRFAAEPWGEIGELLASAGTDSTVRLWTTGLMGELNAFSLGPGGTPMRMDHSPDGRHVAVPDQVGPVTIWDAIEGELVLTLPEVDEGAGTWSAAYSPDGTRILTAGPDRILRTYLPDLDDLVELARSRVTRSLTTEECQKYLHVEECPERP